MKKKALITVIVPIYNEATNLAETLDSLINQTYTNISILISDNDSTDNSLAIARRYAKQDSRIQIFTQKEGLSAANNFKFLIDQVCTPFAFMLGGHDILAPYCIEQCYEKFTSDNIACVYPLAKFFGKANKQTNANSNIGIDSKDKTTRLLKLLRNLEAGTAFYSMYRTKIMQQCSPASIRGGDLYWLFQIAQLGAMVSTDDVLFHRREDRVETPKEKQERYLKYIGINTENYSFNQIIQKLTAFVVEDDTLSYKDKKVLISAIVGKYQKKNYITPKVLSTELFQSLPPAIKLQTFLTYLKNIPSMLLYSIVRYGRAIFSITFNKN